MHRDDWLKFYLNEFAHKCVRFWNMHTGLGVLIGCFSAEEEVADMMLHAGALAQQSRDPMRRNSSDSVLKALYGVSVGQSSLAAHQTPGADQSQCSSSPIGQNERMCMRSGFLCLVF